ncbi:hypothetical protein D3C81_2242230 [compost metagenome]
MAASVSCVRFPLVIVRLVCGSVSKMEVNPLIAPADAVDWFNTAMSWAFSCMACTVSSL